MSSLIMSKLIYSEAPEQKKEVQSKPSLTSHSGLMITAVVIVAISLFIAFGFVYLGYSQEITQQDINSARMVF